MTLLHALAEIEALIEGDGAVTTKDTAYAAFSFFRNNLPEIRKALEDAERMDFMEQNLCRAGEVMEGGRCVKLARCWQIMGELETLRETVDAYSAAMTKDTTK